MHAEISTMALGWGVGARGCSRQHFRLGLSRLMLVRVGRAATRVRTESGSDAEKSLGIAGNPFVTHTSPSP